MADTKITGLTENTAPISTDLMEICDDPGGSALNQKITMATLQSLLAVGIIPGGRLTLTTATPVTTADVTAAATLYYTPYIHDRIGLYDGTSWRSVLFVEKSITLVGTTASRPYDVWGYLSAGTLALELLVWTNGTTRATALAYQDGRLVKSGDATRRYLGTIYVNSSGGQTDDSIVKRFVSNYYNRIPRRMYDGDATSHNYTTGTWRSWNGDDTIRLEFILGVLEDAVTIYLNSGVETAYVGVGLDATNANATSLVFHYNGDTVLQIVGGAGPLYPATGYHYLQAIELGVPGATQSEVYIGATIAG